MGSSLSSSGAIKFMGLYAPPIEDPLLSDAIEGNSSGSSSDAQSMEEGWVWVRMREVGKGKRKWMQPDQWCMQSEVHTQVCSHISARYGTGTREGKEQ